MSFGKLIRIERQVSGSDYFCRDGTTGEIFPVHVLPEFADEIEEAYMEPGEKEPHSPPKQCVFQKKDPGGSGFSCAIYPTRPAICKKFTCYRMLISHQDSGDVRGKVIGSRELVTDDAALRAIWDNEIAPQSCVSGNPCTALQQPPGGSRIQSRITGAASADDHEWVSNVLTILASHGYRGDPVE